MPKELRALGPYSILEECADPPDVRAHGVQHDSTKRTNPIWGQPKATRDQRRNVYISQKHNQDLIGRDSPGFEYEPKRVRSLPSWSQGTAAQRPAAATAKYPEQVNDLMGKTPDNQTFKYKIAPRPNQAVASLDAMYNQPGYTGFKTGVISPGPMRYTPNKESTRCIKHGHAPDIGKTPPSWSLRDRTKLIEMQSATGEKVAPGSYNIPQAHGTQPDNKESKPLWGFYRHDRFQQKLTHGDPGRLWDGEGKQKELNSRAFNRSPSFGFGTSTRDKVKKVNPAHTQADRGPAADLPHFRRSMPELPTRREQMKWSDVPAG